MPDKGSHAKVTTLECLTRLSHKSVAQECPTKSVLRVFYRSVPVPRQECHVRVSYKNAQSDKVSQKASCKSARHEYCWRKFRSETSDNMDSWTSRGGKSQRGEEKQWEDQRRKMQTHGKVGRSRFTVFFNTPPHYTTPHSTPSTPLHSTPLHSTPLHSTPAHYTQLQYTGLHPATLPHYITLHHITPHYALDCITLHYTTLTATATTTTLYTTLH